MKNRWLVYKQLFLLQILKIIVLVFPYGTGNTFSAKLIGNLYPFTKTKRQTNLPILKRLLTADKANQAWTKYVQNIGISQHQIYYYAKTDLSWPQQCELKITGAKHLKQAMSKQCGTLLMTYHHHFNMLFCILMGRFKYSITTIAMDPKVSPLYRDFSHIADKIYQNSALHFNSGNYAMVKPGGFIRPILRAFDKQHLVITANDFPDPFSANKRIELEFMSSKITCPTGTVELAIKKNIPVIAAYLRWLKGSQFELVIEPVTAELKAQQKHITTETVMQQYLMVLKKMIDNSPGLWEGWEWLKPVEDCPD